MFQEANKTQPDIDTMKNIVEHKSNSISFSFLLAYELKLKSEEKKLTTLEATIHHCNYTKQVIRSGQNHSHQRKYKLF